MGKHVVNVRVIKVAWLALTACLMVFGSAACMHARAVSREQVVGDWHSTDGASISLQADGEFKAEKFPLQLAAPHLYSAPMTFSGTWKLIPAGRYDGQHIEISFQRSSGSLEVSYRGDKVRLFFWIGDPDDDNHYWFDRTPSS